MRLFPALLLEILLLTFTVSARPSHFLNGRSEDALQTLTSCLEDNHVNYVTQSSANWTQYSTPFNLRLKYTPNVITIPRSSQGVSNSVKCAAQAGLKVQAKSGGHSYASFSSGGQDGSVIVDLENFNSVKVDPVSLVAKVGAGNRLGNIALALYAQGQRGVPHGTCPGVGIGGHATHGGFGYASRKWGLTLDTIVGLDVVLANGDQIHATETDFPDIFFAVRGAGESFGIVTNFYLKTFPAPSYVLRFSANLKQALKDVEVATTGFQKLQDFVLSSKDLTPNITIGMNANSAGGFALNGWCMDCDEDYFKNNVLPAMVSGYPATDLKVTKLGYIKGVQELADPDPLQQPLSGYNKHDTFYAKSVVTKNNKPLSTAAIRSFWSYVINHQGQGPFFSITNLYGGPGSQINRPPVDGSSFANRDAMWVTQNYGHSASGQPPFNPTIIGLISGLNWATVSAQPDGDFSGYPNYVDPELTAIEAATLYYGPKTYNKLLRIKREVDPDFVFWNPQAIGNAPAFATN